MTRERSRQRGIVLPLLAIGMLALIGIVGLSIDVGHAFLNKTRLQNSLDSAALRAARTLLLTDDPVAASADARDAFGEHLGGEMSGLSADDLVVQYSDTLVPFVPDGSRPRFVRAAFERFSTDVFFSGVLQGQGGSMDIAGTAVAGPIPVGYPGAARTCDVAALMLCGLPGDDDCADGSCFGYRGVGSRTEYELRLGPDADGTPPDGVEPARSGLEIPSCGEGSPFPGCVPAPEGVADPGNVRLHELDCGGAGCVRESLAGAFDACLTTGDPVRVEGAGSPAPPVQGLMSRFGAVGSALRSSDYPPDVVTTDRLDDVDYWYDRYRRDVASRIANGSTGDGVPYRRVLTVPVASCGADAGGSSTGTLLGFVCLFLTRLGEGEPGGAIYGQLVGGCEASGEQGASIPAMSGAYDGPMEIVLYKDPDSNDS